MSVVRVHKSANYTVMSNHHFKEKDMSLKAKGLLSLMLSLPDTWNYSIAGLVKLSKDGKDSVMSALGELEDFGYLVRQKKINSKGQFSGVEYNIYEEPQLDIPVAENQHSGNQHAEKQKAGKQHSENPPQLNTNTLTTNEFNTNELNTNQSITKELEEVILSDVLNEELRELYFDFVIMRNSIGSPTTARGLKMLISRNERLSNFNIETQKNLLETAIINNWKSVYMPTETPQQDNSNKRKTTYKREEQRYSESGYDALKNFNLGDNKK